MTKFNQNRAIASGIGRAGAEGTSPFSTNFLAYLLNFSLIIIFQKLEVSRNEYQSQLEIVSTLKRQLNDLELKETEEINQLELERSLLNAEFDCETQKISKAKMKIALLRHKETRLSGIYEELQKEFQAKMSEAQSRITTFEEGLQRLEETANFEQPDLAQLTQIKEQLEVERKVCFSWFRKKCMGDPLTIHIVKCNDDNGKEFFIYQLKRPNPATGMSAYCAL